MATAAELRAAVSVWLASSPASGTARSTPRTGCGFEQDKHQKLLAAVASHRAVGDGAAERDRRRRTRREHDDPRQTSRSPTSAWKRFGRKVIQLAEHEMAGLPVTAPRRVRRQTAAQGCADHRLVAHDDPDRRGVETLVESGPRSLGARTSSSTHRSRRRRGRRWPDGTPEDEGVPVFRVERGSRSRSTGGAPTRR